MRAIHQTPPETGIANPMESAIDALNQTPIDSIRFSTLARLKFGRDDLSERPVSDLRDCLSAADLSSIDGCFDDARDRNSAVHWRLRRLTIELAICKMATDEEIRRNAEHGPARPEHRSKQSRRNRKPL